MARKAWRAIKAFDRVFIFWWSWGAFQAYFYPCISFGVHIDFARPLLDIHFLWFTLALGKSAHLTELKDRHRHTCRGFLFADNPYL